MRTEFRKVTVDQQVYIAEDGKEFTDHTKCRNHEIYLLEQVVELYTDEFERCDLHTATFLNINNAEDVKNFKLLSNYCGMTDKGIDDTPGVYMWNNGWIKISYFVERVKGLHI